MNGHYKILYIGGGFDILHEDHRSFIKRGIEGYEQYYGNLDKIVVGLKPDSVLNSSKGINRPFFKLDWRIEDVGGFLRTLNISYEIITTTSFWEKLSFRNDVVAQVRSDYLCGGKKMQSCGVEVLYVKALNKSNTTDIETTLFQSRKKSNCRLRKVSAILLRKGRVVEVGWSGSGDCDCCEKFKAYKKGRGELSKKVKCDFPHAEIVVLEKAIEGDDLLITDSPCKECAMEIVRKKIRRVTYLQGYHDLRPLDILTKGKVFHRKAGQ